MFNEESYDIYLKEIREKEAEGKGLFEKNLMYVVRIARRYWFDGLSIMDMVQDGNLGLLKAVKRYRSDRGAKFTSYAYRWIKTYILRGIYNSVERKERETHSIEKAIEEKKEEVIKAKIINAEDIIFNSELKNLIGLILTQLSIRESLIMRLRYGFFGENFGLELIAIMLGISIETVRNIQKRCLIKIRKGYPDLKTFIE